MSCSTSESCSFHLRKVNIRRKPVKYMLLRTILLWASLGVEIVYFLVFLQYALHALQAKTTNQLCFSGNTSLPGVLALRFTCFTS